MPPQELRVLRQAPDVAEEEVEFVLDFPEGLVHPLVRYANLFGAETGRVDHLANAS